MPFARILSMATALPPFRFTQVETRDAAREIFSGRLRDFDRLAPVFLNSGIECRYSAVPLDWYRTPRRWKDRNDAFLSTAVTLLEQASRQALDQAGLVPTDIDSIIAVTSTGIATPSLDALILQRLQMRPDVRRTPLFGLGCAGGTLGLARAAEQAEARPGRTVLLLVTELCTLSFRHGDISKANIVATALFGDGAAALILRADGEPGPIVRAAAEHTWPDTLDIMGWRVEDDGLGVIFSQSIPILVRERFGAVVTRFLEGQAMSRADLAGVICHPGGAKVLDALAEVLAPATAGLDVAAEVLHQHGNMSAVTVLFVLERLLAAGMRGPHLMTALGPGFTAALTLLDL
jgi:alkylresorcinol/alkylpyrone synthase